MDEKEAKSTVDLIGTKIRVNDFIMLKLISIFNEYAAFYKVNEQIGILSDNFK